MSQLELNQPLAPTLPRLPQAKSLPLLGSLPFFLRDPFHYLAESRKKYGEIYEFGLGPSKVVFLNHPRHGQHVLRDNGRNYSKGDKMWDALRELLGNGLVVSEGDFWRRQRRMMQPHFHRRRLAVLAERMMDAIESEIDKWPEESSEFDFFKAVTGITVNVIVRSMFGMGLSAEDRDTAAECMAYCLDYMLLGMATNSLPSWMPLPGKKKYRNYLKTFNDLTDRMIADARAGNIDPNSLLAMLVEATDADSGDQMTDAQLRDEMLNLFLAGYETTSIVLSWSMYYLTQDPVVMAKLWDEIETVLGARPPTGADLHRMPYSRMVLQEAMRIRPASWFIPRLAVEDDEIDGYFIPAGTAVVSLTYAYHHHPDIWPDSETFDPERFAPGRDDGRPDLAFVPFGAGKRMCVGREFAYMEGQFALIRMMQRYVITAVSGKEAKPALSTTLRPKNGVWVQLKKRT